MFGCPMKIVTNNAQYFKSSKCSTFYKKFNIKVSHSNTYYLQGNGLADSPNKMVVRILNVGLLVPDPGSKLISQTNPSTTSPFDNKPWSTD